MVNANKILKNIEISYSEEIQHLSVNNQLIWPVIRYSIRKFTFMKKNSVNYESFSDKTSYRNGIATLLLLIKQLMRNINYKKNNYDYTFLECVDRIDPIYGDIYTYAFKKEISNYNTILRPTLSKIAEKEFSSTNKNIFSLGLPYIMFAVKNRIRKAKYPNEVTYFINHICSKYELDSQYIYNDIDKFFVFFNYYNRILKKLEVKKIVFYAGYNITNLALAKSSNDMGIQTFEIQHGNFTEDDYNYHYFHKEFLKFDKFFANKFYCFSSKFKEILMKNNSYFHGKDIIEIGFPILQTLKPIKNLSQEKVKILVIPTTLFNLDYEMVLYELIKVLEIKKNIEIYIRFHPNIINQDIIKHINLKFNKKVIIDKNSWRYSIVYFDYFIGEYSTTLLEAEYIGKRVFLLDTEISIKSKMVMLNPIIVPDFSRMQYTPYKWDYKLMIADKLDLKVDIL